jgi:hypothetical protein
MACARSSILSDYFCLLWNCSLMISWRAIYSCISFSDFWSSAVCARPSLCLAYSSRFCWISFRVSIDMPDFFESYVSLGSTTVGEIDFAWLIGEFWRDLRLDLVFKLLADSWDASLIALLMILSWGALRVWTKSRIEPDLWLTVWDGWVDNAASGISVIIGFEWGSNF